MIYLNKNYTHTFTNIYIYIYNLFMYFTWRYNQPHAIHLKVMTLKQMSNYSKN